MNLRTMLYLLLSAGLLVFATACGGGSDDPDPTPDTNQPTPDTSTPDTAAPDTAEPLPVDGSRCGGPLPEATPVSEPAYSGPPHLPFPGGPGNITFLT